MVGEFVIMGFSKTSNCCIAVFETPHSLVTSKVTVKVPSVSYEIFSGFCKVDVAGVPPENVQL